MAEEKKGIMFGEEYANTEFELIEDGEYEVVLKAERRRTKNGENEYLSLDYKVREDVDQPFKGRHVFEKFFKDKVYTDFFDFKRTNQIVITQPNFKQHFEDVDEVIQYLNGMKLRIGIEKIYDDYLDKDVNKVVNYSYKPSRFPGSTIANPEKADTIPLKDEELPW